MHTSAEVNIGSQSEQINREKLKNKMVYTINSSVSRKGTSLGIMYFTADTTQKEFICFQEDGSKHAISSMLHRFIFQQF